MRRGGGNVKRRWRCCGNFIRRRSVLADLSVKQVEEKLKELSVAQAQRALHVTKEN